MRGLLVPYYIPGTVWEQIAFNLDPVDGRVPLGACRDVRKAIALGTDREALVQSTMRGQSHVLNSFLPQEHWAYPLDGLATHEYDRVAAEDLLAGLGFVDEDGDGFRTATRDITCTITVDGDGNTKEQLIPVGTPLELTLATTAGNAMREEIALVFQQNMADIGVMVVLELEQAMVFFQDGPEGPVFGRRFDLAEFAWLSSYLPSLDLFYCSQIPSDENDWSGQNATGWCDPEFDRVGRKAERELERDSALASYYEPQRLFAEGLPILPLFMRVNVMATAPDVVNFYPDPTVASETWNIEEWAFGG